ncbi:hypothetical protein GCM10012275_13030 [Longimycelium tulufanense]|uniref:Uncharacterized protein n=1 Tax=Longimycelium tulufanense TaxID=907463 RepID=A0A8J3FVD5_9PSEU|nr:hypothetical protein GCM10012275_13030 [Longimycelium tulufanense]
MLHGQAMRQLYATHDLAEMGGVLAQLSTALATDADLAGRTGDRSRADHLGGMADICALLADVARDHSSRDGHRSNNGRQWAPVGQEPVQMIPARIMLSRGVVTALAETTAAPGVLLAPEVTRRPRTQDEGRSRGYDTMFTGRFVLVHAGSGWSLAGSGPPHDPQSCPQLRRMARHLAATGVDWTQPLTTLLDSGNADRVHRAVRDARHTTEFG